MVMILFTNYSYDGRCPRLPHANHSLQFSGTIFIVYIKYKSKYASIGYYQFHVHKPIMQRWEEYFESEVSSKIFKNTIPTTLQFLDLCK